MTPITTVVSAQHFLISQCFVLSLLVTVKGFSMEGVWGEWSNCTVECGGGVQLREKMCNGYLCDQAETSCHLMDCDDPFVGVQWSDCSESCGGNGIRTRTGRNGTTQQIRCNTQSCEPTEGNCVGDVIFVLDSSGSIGFLNWSVSAQFVLDVMQKLKISPEGTHVGVVIYSTEVETSFGLNTYFSVEEIEPIMLNLFYMAGVTNTADGIKTMHEIMKAQGRGSAIASPTAIVVTDGNSNIEPDRTITEADDAKDDGIQIFAVAVGDNIVMDEMRGIASHSDFVFTATGYGDVQKLTDEITKMMCVTAKCGQCRHYGACSESCGAEGSQEGTKDCWLVSGETHQEIAGTRNTETCSRVCETPDCPTTTTTTTTTQTTTTTPTTTTTGTTITASDTWVVDCSRCDFSNGQNWLPDRNDCHKYFVCEPLGGTGNYRVHHFTCGQLFWHQSYHTCVRAVPAEADCVIGTGSTYTQAPSSTTAPCPYEPYPENKSEFWIKGATQTIRSCNDGMEFINTGGLCDCIPVDTVTPICADDLLLHFSFEDDYNDVTCHHAIATQYGSGVSLQYDSTRGGNVACFTGNGHMEVPFLRTWFANNKVNKFTVSVRFKRLGETNSPQSILNNGDCLDTAGFAIGHSEETVMANITTVRAGKSGQAGQVSDNEWHHVVWMYGGHNLRVYLDGVLKKTIRIKGYLVNNDVPMYIGSCCGEHFLNGCVDELRIYTRILSLAEIQHLP